MTRSDADAAARRRIVCDLEHSLLVEAAAGTGKTTILVRRLVQLLATGRGRIEGVVAVTFTRKAAGELKLRLRQALDRARVHEQDPMRRAHLGDALARLEEASIGTIHSFCAEILRERPVEAAIDPEFGEIDEEQAEQLFRHAFRRWIERALADMPEGLARALGRLAALPFSAGSSPLDRLLQAARKLREWRDYPEPWQRRPFDRAAAVDRLVEQVAGMAALYDANPDSKDPLRQALAPAWRLHEWIRRSEQVAPRDYDALEARLIGSLRELSKGIRRRGRGPWPGRSRDEVVQRRDELVTSLRQFKVQADADLAALLRDELQGALREYEQLKNRAGQLDFLDLLVRARDLIRDDEQVRRHLQGRITHLFVDEFQDTDPLQAEILMLLASDDPLQTDWTAAVPVPGKLFLVGDPKQSIYRFRRADVVLYEQVKQRLAQAGVGIEVLSRSWRSLPPLQATVNAAFSQAMTGDVRAGQPEYVPLQQQRQPNESQPAVVALPIPRPYGDWGRITAWKLREQEPEGVAAFLEWLFRESGWVVQDPRTDSAVPVRAGHVALLFRRFMSWGRDVTRPYLAALEARGIPHLLAGGRSFHQREEVGTLRAALTAIEWPEDELAVFATLKGSLFAISDADLLRYRQAIGRLHPFRLPGPGLDESLQPVADALEVLARLHRCRNDKPAGSIVRELLDTTRAYAGFAMRPAGNQVLANVQQVIDRARAFEVRGGLSFRGFVQRLADDAERPGAGESPIPEQDAEGVRILTVHGAKGLEFPVVVLADITAALSHAEPASTIDPQRRLCATRLLGCAPWELVEQSQLERDRDRAEGVRVAYVAATRARDLLVVPALGEYPWDDGWVSPLNAAIYPPRERYRHARAAVGCPPFGDRTVLERPLRAHGEAETSVQPGEHRSEAGVSVVWWDPALLHLDVAYNFGLRQEELLAEPDSGEPVPGKQPYREWKQRRRAALQSGSTPQLEVTVVSLAREGPPEFEGEVVIEHLPRPADGCGGRRFGTLVHTVLRDTALDATRQQVEQLSRYHGRVLGAPEPEIAAARARVIAVLGHELLRRARRAAEWHRELPFLLSLEGNRVADGVIDLLFRENDRWTIVDFKTDVDTEALEDRYRNQALWYLYALQRLRGASGRAVLLAV